MPEHDVAGHLLASQVDDAVPEYKAAREAFDKGELQLQVEGADDFFNPKYSGPCAVGVALPSELRSHFDNIHQMDATPVYLTVEGLVERGSLSVPAHEIEDMDYLQAVHDIGDPQHFERVLEGMELKYVDSETR